MPERLVELLLKGVRRLDPDEQDEVLGVLLAGVTPQAQVAPGAPGTEPAPPGALRMIDPWHIDIPALPTLNLATPGMAQQPIGMLDALGRSVPTDPDTELKVLPVRLPVADYERLRAFSREHGFSMAVIIRTLVERFLDERAARPAEGQPG